MMVGLLEGQNPIAKKLSAWISRVMLEVGEARGGLKLHIKDIGEKSRRELVRQYPISPEKPAERLALEVTADAEEEARGTDARHDHTFILYAYRGQETMHFDSTGFTVRGDPFADEGTSEDAGSGSSLLGQAYRHLDNRDKTFLALFKASVEGWGEMLSRQQSILDQLASENKTLREEQRTVVMEKAKLEYDKETQKVILGTVEKVVEIAAPIVVPKLIKRFAGSDDEDGEKETKNLPPQTVAPIAPPIPLRQIEGGKKKKGSKR